MTRTMTRAALRAAGIDPRFAGSGSTRLALPSSVTQAGVSVPEKASRPMNRWEAAYAALLDARRSLGDVRWWGYEAVTLRLGEDTRYTPDGTAGTGYKGGYLAIIPLCHHCHAKQDGVNGGWLAIGLTAEGRRRAAENTEARWKSFCGGVSE